MANIYLVSKDGKEIGKVILPYRITVKNRSEEIIERARKQKFPHLPSLMSCVEIFSSKEAALTYAKTKWHKNYGNRSIFYLYYGECSAEFWYSLESKELLSNIENVEKYSDEDIEKAAEEFWSSLSTNEYLNCFLEQGVTGDIVKLLSRTRYSINKEGKINEEPDIM